MLPGFSQNDSHESLEVQPPGPLPPSRSNSRACFASPALMSPWLSAKATHSLTCARSSQYARHLLLLVQLPSSGTGNVTVDSCALASAAERTKIAPSTTAPRVRTAVSFASYVISFKRIFVIRKRVRLGQLVRRGLYGSPDLGRDVNRGVGGGSGGHGFCLRYSIALLLQRIEEKHCRDNEIGRASCRERV